MLTSGKSAAKPFKSLKHGPFGRVVEAGLNIKINILISVYLILGAFARIFSHRGLQHGPIRLWLPN